MLWWLLFAGCNEAPRLDGDASSGQLVFDQHCAGCHGADGKLAANDAADLSIRVPEMSDDAIEAAVVEGVGEMPPASLEDQELADLIAWLRASFGQN